MTLHVLGICLPGSFAARPPSPRAPGRYGYALVQLMVDACCTSNQSLELRAETTRSKEVRRKYKALQLVEAVLMHRLELFVRELGVRL